ncbi:three-helix bundle dimerization domain-containing protein [Agromyces sp. LHK192]|uniref:three-helix bundle dimerization domain-containing protein n=1 Tax=Agromyces sp. LHK192 TaxID=2498704 RepID=UPI00196B9A0E|nr:hypothetical protein [Agromyces sp. LHK192]
MGNETGIDQEQLFDQVVVRLQDHFPDANRTEIERIVGEEHDRLEGNPIQDFVPVLVEHEARERLRDEGFQVATRAVTADESAGPAATAHAAPDPYEVERAAELQHEDPVSLLPERVQESAID